MRTVHSFGLVLLELEKICTRDAGVYVCKAKNPGGQAESRFELKVEEASGLDGQVPQFTSKLEPSLDLKDGDSVHLLCTFVPKNDQNMAVTWTKDGEPLPFSSRIKALADFGTAILDIAGVDSKDSGVYACSIKNKYGEDVTLTKLECTGKSEVVSQSFHPNTLEALTEKFQVSGKLPGIQ